MAKIRVYELAKNLNMTNKMLLTKIEAMNIEVASHMSSLDESTVARIKNNLFGKKESDSDDKRVRETVIRRRKRTQTDPSGGAGETAGGKGAEHSAEETPASAADAAGEEKVAPEIKASVTKEDEEPKAAGAAEAEPEAASETVETKEEEKIKSSRPRKSASAKIISLPPDQPAVTKEAAPETPVAEDDVASDAPPEKKNQEELPVEEKMVEPSQDKKAEPVKADISAKQVEAETAAEKKEEQPVKTEEIKDEPKKKKKKVKKFSAAKIIKLPDADFDPESLKSKVTEVKVVKRGKPAQTSAPAPQRQPVESAPEAPSVDARPARKGKKGKVSEVPVEQDHSFGKKKAKRKTVVEGRSLYAEGKGRKGRKPGKGQKVKAPQGQKTQITTPKAIKRRIKVDDTIILAELAKRMGIKANDMIIKLLNMGVMATVNQTIDYDTAALVATEFGFEVEKAAFEEDILLNLVSQEEDSGKLVERAPVVTIMGHVDHGKTSLLDVIRRSSVTTGEAGGITQHIGAYNVKTEGGQITFLDTPGHEAFTAMRARGAKVTDLVILVVAADDGVMPQTVEALNHAKAAEVPIIVAVNKIDKEDADPDRVKRELSDYGIVAEDWGGDAIFVNVSAKQELGINDLLEMVLLQAEVLELKANPERYAAGHVVEAKLDSGRGPIATVLVQQGTLKSGQSVVCGNYYGKIRAMFDDTGAKVVEAGPSIPVEILGLTGVPEAGDELIAVAEDKDAKQVSSHRVQKARALELAKSSRMSLEGLFEQIEDGKVKDLNMIIKADVHGSIEALKESLEKLSTSEVKINVIHSATGTVSESDVSLASVSNAIVLGFNVRPATKVQDMAKEEAVDMRFYDIIYDAIKDVKDAMVGLMESTFVEKILGRAEVRDTFVIPKRGTIAGSFVLEGKIQRGQKVRLLREGVIIYDGNISSLKRFKDDAKEVTHGYECGIGIENFNDIKIGDTIDCYMMEEIKPTLE